MSKDPTDPSSGKSPAKPDAAGPDQSDTGEELAHLDDAVIGRAFRGSALALLVIIAIVAGILIYVKRKPHAGPIQQTQITAPTNRQVVAAEIPTAKFTEVTAAAGITFIHNSGAYGEKLLHETMGGGVAFFDFDNDGDPDLLFINSTWPADKIPAGKQPTTMALYRNDGKGHFDEVTAGSGFDVSFRGMGVTIGDYDNDGRPDVFVTAVGGNHLFHNEGNGKFREVTAEAGVGGLPGNWSTTSAWIDYDNDGRLDLFVGNYVKWSREIDFEVGFKIDGVTRAYGQPMNFAGTFPYLYHNDGNGRFTEVTAPAGLQITNFNGMPAAKMLGVAPVDLNHDGWIDLVIANDTVQNFVFSNQHNGTFKEIGALCGVAFDNNGQTRGAMGIDAACYRNDDALGIAIGNFANEMVALYVTQSTPMTFADEAIPEGIGPASRLLLKFGIFFFDYDLDGRLDVLTSNGHLDAEITKVQKSQSYRQPAQLFWNSGASKAATFVSVPPEKAGADLFKPIVGRGSAFADIDGDGDLDVVLTQIDGPPLLLRNDQNLGHHWLRLKLVGTTVNRDAIGALVKVKLGKQLLTRQVMPTRSYLSASELPVTIGLGMADKVDGVEVIWPGGRTQPVVNVRLDGVTVIEQVR